MQIPVSESAFWEPHLRQYFKNEGQVEWSSLGRDLQSPLAGTARRVGEVETSELDEEATHHSIQTQVFARWAPI